MCDPFRVEPIALQPTAGDAALARGYSLAALQAAKQSCSTQALKGAFAPEYSAPKRLSALGLAKQLHILRTWGRRRSLA